MQEYLHNGNVVIYNITLDYTFADTKGNHLIFDIVISAKNYLYSLGTYSDEYINCTVTYPIVNHVVDLN